MICIPFPYYFGAFFAIALASIGVAHFIGARVLRKAARSLRNPDGHSETTLAMMMHPQFRWSAPAPHETDREDVERYRLQILRILFGSLACAAIILLFVVVPC